MKSKSYVRVFAPLLVAAAVFAQAPQMPQPAPELKKLDYFVGTWNTDAEMKASPAGPASKVTGTDKIEWMQGNFFLLIHSTFTTSLGNGVEVAAMGYDSAKKVYTYASFNSFGERESGTGTVEGDTWTWNSDAATSPGSMKWRFTQKILSPTSYSMKFEMAFDGTTWSTVMEGKVTKQ